MNETVTTGTEVPHDTQAKVFPPLDPTTFGPQLFWLAVTFVALYLLLSRIALPRVGEVIEERADRIKRDLDAAERLKGETENARLAYETALADARANAGKIAKDTRDRLNADVEKERAKVEAQVSAKITEAEARIASSKTKALQSVNDIAADTAGQLVKHLIDKDASPDEIRKALQPAAGE